MNKRKKEIIKHWRLNKEVKSYRKKKIVRKNERDRIKEKNKDKKKKKEQAYTKFVNYGKM